MSRREQIRMSEEEVRRFLRGRKTVILTSNGPSGFPHPMPMWFVLDDDGSLRMTTFRKSQKVKNLRRDPRVSLLAESGESYAELAGVVLQGRAELSEDRGQIADTLLQASGTDLAALDREALERARDTVRRTAEKRVLIRCKPERTISWNHAKLAGAY